MEKYRRKRSRHHHQNHDENDNNSSDEPSTTHQPRPFILRAVSVLTLILPPILLILALSFSLKAIYEPSFALSAVFDSSYNPVPISNSSNSSALTYKASPFYTCNDLTAGNNAVASYSEFNQTCMRTPFLGKKGMKMCTAMFASDGVHTLDQHFCQKLVVSAELFVAGAVLVGIALLSSFPAVLLGFGDAASSAASVPTHYHTRPHGRYEPTARSEEVEGKTASNTVLRATSLRFLWSFVTLLALLGAICLAAAQMLGINALIDWQSPSGEDNTPGVSEFGIYQSSWYMGSGALVWPSVAWLSALLGTFVASRNRF
ncbi:hypothetical protein MMC25_003440 [Agyrium rufum]|nr:hypothetical protein [Agyrium rufum]